MIDQKVEEGEFFVRFADGDGHDYGTVEEACQAIADEAFRLGMSSQEYMDSGCTLMVPVGYDVSKIRVFDPILLCTPQSKPPYTRCGVCAGSCFDKRGPEIKMCQECCATGVAGEKAYREKRTDKALTKLLSNN